MSKTTELLEAAVAEVIAHRLAEGERPSARQRLAMDRAFATVMKIVAPRIRHFIKQYGLTHHWEDAEQVCAIGVHRAIEAYDPEKAMFTTFVNWQLRGELQGLRFRLMDDQRPSAKKVDAVTISLHGKEHGPAGEEISLETLIEDEGATGRTEACAADYMAAQTSQALLDEYVRHLRSMGIAQLQRKAREAQKVSRRKDRPDALPKYVRSQRDRIDPEEIRKLEERISRDRAIVSRHLFGQDEEDAIATERELTRERIRQITRRAARVIGELATGNPRFQWPQSQCPPSQWTNSQTDDEPRNPLLPRGNHKAARSGEIRVTEPDHTHPDQAAFSTVIMIGTRSSSRH